MQILNCQSGAAEWECIGELAFAPRLPVFGGLWFIVAHMPQPSPSQTAEDYLERIQELIEEKGYARVVDIASSLDVKQASVTSMVQKLGELGYLNYEKYRGLVLTDKGRAVATGIQKRHETLARFFSLFGLDAETQQRDIEGIEHHLSPATVEILADLATFFEKHPDTLKSFVKSRRGGRGLES
jgi:DtxR family transcriptional regulator, manganese transport regulator